MKKLLILLLACMLVFSMMFSLIACGGDENDDTDDTDNTGDNTDTPGDDDDVNSDDTDVNYDPTTGGEGIELPIIPVPSTPNTPTEGETEEGTEQPEA